MARVQIKADLLARMLLPGHDVTIDGAAFDYLKDCVVFKIEGPGVPAGADWCEAFYRKAEDGTVIVDLEKGRG